MDQEFMMYILAMYNQPTNTGQIYNVLIGRTTPTMLYLVEKKQWHGHFGLFNDVNRKQLDQLQELFLAKETIRPVDKKFELTAFGQQQLERLFNPTWLIPSMGFFTARYRQYVWDFFQLITQIVSEKIFSNRQFSPMTTSPTLQSEAKLLLKHAEFDSEQWVIEVVRLFEQFPDPLGDLLSNELAGNGVIGSTDKQLQAHFDLSAFTFFLKKQGAIQLLLNRIDDDFPQLSLLLATCEARSMYRLSPSTFETAQYLSNGVSPSAIARERRLKLNTIHEHIIEMAFVLPDFSYRSFIPDSVYARLDEIYRTGDFSYSKVKEQLDPLVFMHYRLFELERMRE